MKRRVPAILVASLILTPIWASAQERTAPWPVSIGQEPAGLLLSPAPDEDRQDHYGRMAISGLIAGGAAMSIGWHAGRHLADANEGGILIGGLLMTAAIPIGAYLGNSRQGELPLALLASYGIGIAGFFLMGSAWSESTMRNRSIVIPLAQLGTSIWVIVKGID